MPKRLGSTTSRKGWGKVAELAKQRKPDPPSCYFGLGNDVDLETGNLLTPSQCAVFPIGDFVGDGSFASAYDHATDPTKIVKFTADREDATTSARLLGKNLAQSVRIFEVAKLKGKTASAPVLKKNGKMQFERKENQPIFGIVAEKLKGTNRVQEAATHAFSSHYKRRQGSGPNDYSVREIARMADPETFHIGDYVDPYPVEQDCTSYLADKSEAAQKACAVSVGEIFDAIDELAHEAGVIPTDLHSGNWGVKPNGKLAILDLGISAGKKKPPRIKLLAGAVGKRKKR